MKRPNRVVWPVALLALILSFPHKIAAQGVVLTPIEDVACADFRMALAIRETAIKMAKSFEGSPPWPFDINDQSPEAQVWFQTKQSLHEAIDESFTEVRRQRQKVTKVIKDDVAAEAIGNIVSVFKTIDALDTAMTVWRLNGDSSLYRHVSFDVVANEIDELYKGIDLAYHEALKLACSLGVCRIRDSAKVRGKDSLL